MEAPKGANARPASDATIFFIGVLPFSIRCWPACKKAARARPGKVHRSARLVEGWRLFFIRSARLRDWPRPQAALRETKRLVAAMGALHRFGFGRCHAAAYLDHLERRAAFFAIHDIWHLSPLWLRSLQKSHRLGQGL
jgi:hypothetical protein